MFQNIYNRFSGGHFEHITYKTSRNPQNIFVKIKNVHYVSESRCCKNITTDTVLMSWTQRLVLLLPWSTVDTRE